MSAINSGTALDVNALVSQLVTAERTPFSQRFDRVEAVARQKISAFGSLSAAFDGLKRSLDTLKASNTFGGRTAKSSDDTSFTASASSAVAAGSYSVSVESLASAQKLVSAGLTKDAGLGTGQLSLTVGDKAFSVDISSGNDTPNAIRTAINAAATLAGAKVNATVINADDGQRLVLTATQPGSSNTITITNTSTPPNNALDALVFDPGTLTNLTEQSAASDARVIVDGVTHTSSSNTITDFIPGLTFNLKTAAPGELKTLTVATDNSTARSAIQGVVGAFNAALNALNAATKFNPATNVPSILTGDSTARSASSQLRSSLGNALAAAGLPANTLGINTNVDGTLVFDAGKFDAALVKDPTLVKDALAGDNGIAAKVGAVVAAFTGTDGIFTSRTTQLNAQLERVAEDRLTTDRRLAGLEQRLRRQFTALDGLLAQSQTTSNFLAQQLAGLSNS